MSKSDHKYSNYGGKTVFFKEMILVLAKALGS
jgi:hypothetical protein